MSVIILRKCLIWGSIVLIAGFIAIVLAGFFFLPGGWLLRESKSPAHLGSGAFVTDAGSFAGCSVYVYARDPRASEPNAPIRLGGPYASDGSVKMEKAIWSSDGSVLAVRARVGEGAGHGFRKYYGKFFVSAYDFRAHCLVAGSSDRRAKSQKIADLIASRRGEGTSACSAPYSGSGRPISPSLFDLEN